MPLVNLTEEQIVQLAPDAASVKAGKGLAAKAKWVLLEFSERAIWGHCQGSGKVPYQTVIDIHHIAFKCSCPSRKFPCKHGLGLLLLYTAHPDFFVQAEEPEWVNAWLAKREEKAEKQEQKARQEAPVDEAAQAKRQAARHQKVLHGIEDLQMWLTDLLRNGFLHIPEQAYSLFDDMARRMVDAQAPGLALRLKNLQEMNYLNESWKYELTNRLSKIYLLSEAYKHLEQQPADWQHEIRTLIGYPQAKEEILARESFADYWLVLHKRSRKVNDLNTCAYWLYGQQTERFALYMSFTAPGAMPEQTLVPGSIYEGELCFYQGVRPIRVLFKSCRLSEMSFLPVFCKNLQEAAGRYRQILQDNPFATEIPLLIERVRLAQQEEQFFLMDSTGRAMPICIEESIRPDLLSITGGKAFAVFLLAGATTWRLHSIWYSSTYYFWKDER